jgi:hypothetical protein
MSNSPRATWRLKRRSTVTVASGGGFQFIPDFTGLIVADQPLLGRCCFFDPPRSTMTDAREAASFTARELMRGAHLQPYGWQQSMAATIKITREKTLKVVRSISAALIAATVVAGLAPAPSVAQEPKGFTVATGLNGARGLRFGPDGALYIAEAGTGGMNSSGCKQVVPPVGPYTGGNSGRISKVSHGKLPTVASGFPSAADALGDLLGVADAAFMDDGTRYALIAGGGCSPGNPGMPNGIAQVDYNTG